MQSLEQDSPRRDPAPTKLAYKMNRLWLTPLFRAFLRVGIPGFAIAFCSLWYFSDEGRRDGISLALSDMRRAVEERPEFMVGLMQIDGASLELAEDIREVVPLDFPVSSFDLDLEQMRQVISGLDAVASADLRIQSGGLLHVQIAERTPAVVWRSRTGLELLDGEGHRVAPLVQRADRPDLPLIAGAGADTEVGEALALLEAAGPISGRVRGLTRMGERRWDLVLDRGQRILLPEQGAVVALLRVVELARAEDMLERDLVVVDMRNPRRPTLRLSGQAVDELRRIKLLEAGAQGG